MILYMINHSGKMNNSLLSLMSIAELRTTSLLNCVSLLIQNLSLLQL